MNPKLGRMQKVELRQIWVDGEASDFTPWLAREENIALLGEALGLDLEVKEQEASVGQFRADILCKETESGGQVLIENQIEPTDHKHLGQLLTYAAGVGATFVVWIAQSFTEEHRAALSWLNDNLDGVVGAPRFYGVEIEVWKIGDSEPAPKFNIVAKPNPWSEGVKQTVQKAGQTAAEQVRWKYWAALLDFLRESGSPLQCKGPSSESWLHTQSPVRGFHFGFEISVRDKFIDVYVSAETTDRIDIFRCIQKAFGEKFEKEIGAKVDWQDKQEASRYLIYVAQDADPCDSKTWSSQHKWLKEIAEKLVNIFPKYIALVSGGSTS